MSTPPARLKPQLTPLRPLRPESSLGYVSSVNIARDCFLLLTAGAAGMAVLLALLPAVGHDQMWCLYVAQRMLHGERLYGPELLESNPPLIMWLMLLPAALTRVLHLPITFLFKSGVVLVGALVSILSVRLLRRRAMNSNASTYSSLFIFLVIFGAMPARDFGQRDHLLSLLCLPYILAAALEISERPRNLRRAVLLLIGFAAGLGVALKPHHLLLVLAVETTLLVKRRAISSLLRPELLALSGTLLLYLAAICLLTPDYLTTILPLLRGTYWAIGDLTAAQLLTESLQLHILAAITVTLVCVRGWHRRCAPAPLLVLAGMAGTVAYYLQGTGWYYQQLPALSFFALALWFGLEMELSTLSKRLGLPKWSPAAILGLVVLSLSLTAFFSGYNLRQPLSFPSGLSDTPDPKLLDGLAPGTPVAILSTVVDDTIPPVFTRHLLWAQRTNNLWVLPAILLNESPAPGTTPRHQIPPERLMELDRAQHRWMVEDLNRWKPRRILVARCQAPEVHCQILGNRHDDLLAWFASDPAFRTVFSRYRLWQSSGMYDAYTLLP